MNSAETPIHAMLILEVLGRPAEHLKTTLEKLIDSMGKEKGVEIKEKKIHDPSPLKDKKDFFTSFAEIEIKTDNLLQLTILLFKYMPAHIDILSPENLILSNNNMNAILNELTRRLLGYDEVARMIQIEKKLLERKIKSLLKENPEKKDDTKDSETESKEEKK